MNALRIAEPKDTRQIGLSLSVKSVNAYIFPPQADFDGILAGISVSQKIGEENNKCLYFNVILLTGCI